MNRVITLLLLLLPFTAGAQYNDHYNSRYYDYDRDWYDPVPSYSYPERSHLYTLGTKMVQGGLISAAVGGAMLLAAIIPDYDGQDNMLGAVFAPIGVIAMAAGGTIAVLGVPAILIGKHIEPHSGPYLYSDDFYIAERKRGFGFILEGGCLTSAAQLYATAGYHFDDRFFLGGGMAPAMSWEGLDLSVLPVYANIRYSPYLNRFSYYSGLSAGMNLLDQTPYLNVEEGIRFRASQTDFSSFWTSITYELSSVGGFMGIKFGWGF